MTDGDRHTAHLWGVIQEWLDNQPFHVSQAQLAKKISEWVEDVTGEEGREVRRDLLTKWKYGQTVPTPTELRALAQVTGVAYDVLLDAMLRDQGYRRGRDQGHKTG